MIMDEQFGKQPFSDESIVPAGSRGLREPEVLDVQSEEVPHLRDYLRVVLKRRWTVLAVALVVFCSVAIATLKLKPLYAGRVLIEINPEPPNVLNFKEILQISGSDVESYRETQYNVLRSRTLASRVVQDLRLYEIPEFYRKRVLLGFLRRDPDVIPSTADPNPPDASSEAFRNSIQNFLNSFDVNPVRRSNLVEVSLYSEDPGLAARISNHLAAQYIEQNLQVKWDETVKASEWLSGRLVELKVKLEKSEEQLQSYAQAHSILFVEERKNLANERLRQLQEEYTHAQADRFQKEAEHSLVQSGRVQDLPGFLSNRLIQDLTVRLIELEREYAELTAFVKPDYPKAVQVRKQLDAVQSLLDQQKRALTQNVVDEYQSAVAREKYLAAAVEQQKKEVNEIAEKSIQYNILKREVDTNKQLFDGLLQRLKEAQISAGLRASNIRVVDPAEVPKAPVKPKVLLNLFAGAVLGLSLGVGLALFQEYLDNTLKTPDEVETLIRLPSLGVLPRFALNGHEKDEIETESALTIGPTNGGADRPPALLTDFAGMEAFRSLRTSILLSAKPAPKLLLVTSALPSEGKTTVSINLGATLASLGSRVVIVDCDMRRPACHRAAGIRNGAGFVQCLTGQVALADAVHPVPGVPNLSLIPCGPIPPNPAELLSSAVTGELLSRLRQDFDYVLVDSPPLLSVTDSRILSTLTDATVLVVRAHSTPFTGVRRAKALLYGSGARILGIALNDVDFRKESYGSGEYRYGYGYGYGSEGDDEADHVSS